MNTVISELLLECDNLVANISEFDYSGEPLFLNAVPGDIICIIGPNYTGKSDWLRTLAGINYPSEGNLRFLGKNFYELNDTDWTRQRLEYAYVRGDTSLLSAASGLANVMLPARYHELDDPETIQKTALDLIDELGVSSSTHRLPAYVRRDQRFKLAIARALIMQPKMLLLDNPFAALDADIARDFKHFLLERVRSNKLALLMVTHDIAFTLEHASKILFVTQEQIYSFDSPGEFLESDKDEVKEYLDKIPVS